MSKKDSKKFSLAKSYRRTIVTIILLVIAQYVLLRWMDGSNAFAVLTASGKNTPMLTTLGAMTLIGLRLYLYLIVPGMAAARFGNATLTWYAEQAGNREPISDVVNYGDRPHVRAESASYSS